MSRYNIVHERQDGSFVTTPAENPVGTCWDCPNCGLGLIRPQWNNICPECGTSRPTPFAPDKSGLILAQAEPVKEVLSPVENGAS
jgi:hypothetical protein